MPIDSREVLRIAALAHLELDADEVETFREQLEQILQYVALLESLDVADTPPTTHPLGRGQALRADSVSTSLSRDEALANAPDRGEGFFKVPRVLRG